ncbi:MAG TPA: UvrD-helicase domain-containing protein [Myxococcales bacterium]|nr:UvrD-helicase domain-containing protein [Myxococcales bacterium]
MRALHLVDSPGALGPLALERNLAIMAGAGAGKTYSLITIGLHLLSGARRDGRQLRPAELCLLTFTDKAAAEMRSRMRERLDALATGEAKRSDEADLRASFAALGRPFPGPELWRRVREDLGSAWIGTFHSLCMQLLRRAPAGFGVDPGFRLLDERESTLLLQDTAERVVLEALERREQEVSDLCRELGFSARGRMPGMVGALRDALVKLREEGLGADQVAITDEQEAHRALSAALERVSEAASRAAALDGARGRFAHCLSACLQALDGIRYETFLHADRFPALRHALRAERTLTNQHGDLGEALKDLKWSALGRERAGKGLLEHYAACRIVPHEAAFRRLVGELQDRHRGELRKRSALDFSELLIRSRDLLRDHPVVRREVQDRMGALLVDEFQDTNRLQLELVALLSEAREGGPRAVPEAGVMDLPLQPAFLCAVGDRKQSIYEFRGADVAVFGQLATLVERNGGRRHYLRTNRRSVPGLIDFFNRFFQSVLVAREGTITPRDYEVLYLPEGDSLEPHRTLRAARPHVERLVYEPQERAPDSRAQDAALVARKVRQLLAPRSGLKVEGADGKLRPAVGKDVAILFRRFTYLEVYRQALARAGIPHRVVRGRGFYAAQEVVDLASLLSVIADPSDALSFAAVLRSPLVALGDAGLYRLVQACGGERLQLKSVRAVERPALVGLSAGELERLDRFLDLHRRLRSERDRLGLRVLLQVALEETEYRVALAGSPFGEQALANVEKLLELAGRWDERAAGDCQRFAAELLALADAEPAEAQADVMDAGDERAVSLLTIHQAKGLEWPVVVVPDLCAGPMPQSRRILFDRALGLGLRPWIDGELEVGRTPRLQQIADELSRREEAEYRRLLYVALTRARDHLVLSGQCKGMKQATWRGYLDRALEADPALRALVADAREGEVPEVRAPAGTQGSLLLDGEERVAAAEARCSRPPPLRPRTAVFPVTQLQNYFLCERRYLYAHVVGLVEFPIHFEVEEEEQPEPLLPGRTRSPNDPRVRGTVAHALLENVDLEAVGDPAALDAQLRRILWELGHEPDTQDSREISAWARGFLATPFAASLRGGRVRVMREVPFALRLEAPGPGPEPEPGGLEVFLKGQIDLLAIDERGGATVIDYKASERHPEGLGPYAFQLDCYALAARRLVGEGAMLRTGIAFLKERDPGPDFREPIAPGALAGTEARLAKAAGELVARSRGMDFRGRDAAYCASIRCGYQYRCHPGHG